MRGWDGLIFVCFAFLVTPVIVCLAEDGERSFTPTRKRTLFLDRLVRAESRGGNLRISASSALGPFQFLEPRSSTSSGAISRRWRRRDGCSRFWRSGPIFQVSRDVALGRLRAKMHAASPRKGRKRPPDHRLAFSPGPTARSSAGSGAGHAGVHPAQPATSPPTGSSTHDSGPASRAAQSEAEGLGAAPWPGRLHLRPALTSKIAVRCISGSQLPASARHGGGAFR